MSQPETPPHQPSKRLDPKPAKLWVLIIGAGLAVLLAAVIAYLVFLYVLDTYKLVPFEAARTAVTLIGVPTAAGAVFVALRSLRLKERQLHTDQLRLSDAAATFELAYDSEHERRRVDQERELRSRYVSAGEQIGSPSAAVRLAGVNAMAQLADDWTAQRQACVDVLCAYLRLPQQINSLGDPDVADGEVRRTVQKLIGEGFRRKKGTEDVNKWPGIDLDLRGAVLADCRMPVMVVKVGNFRGAQFNGVTSFIGSKFQDANFVEASFGGSVTFNSCQFGRANFSRSRFYGAGKFRAAQFLGMAQFERARFENSVDLNLVTSKRPLRFVGASFKQAAPSAGEGYVLVLQGTSINGELAPESDVPAQATSTEDFVLQDEDDPLNGDFFEIES